MAETKREIEHFAWLKENHPKSYHMLEAMQEEVDKANEAYLLGFEACREQAAKLAEGAIGARPREIADAIRALKCEGK